MKEAQQHLLEKQGRCFELKLGTVLFTGTMATVAKDYFLLLEKGEQSNKSSSL